jgi:hypothetical protein
MNFQALDDFWQYVEKQIEPSVEDIKNLEDQSRKHVQKLVYTNLVDRFDVMVDHLILENCRSDFVLEAISPSLNETVNEAYLLQLLMNAETVQDAIDEKLKSAIRNTILRKRHSLKLQFLLKLFERLEYTTKKPQVQPGNGNIVLKASKTQVNVPHSVCGYADWLYARRNAIVHGAGEPKYLNNDKVQLEKLYDYKCPDTFKLKIGAITSSIKFYGCIYDIIYGE